MLAYGPMTRTIMISDDLAARLDSRRKAADNASLDTIAEAAIVRGLALDDFAENDSVPYDDDELKSLLAEADVSGPAVDWDGAAIRAKLSGDRVDRRRTG